MFETPKGNIKAIVYMGILRDEKLLIVDYEKAPNPDKKGWWIPAPDLEFGEDPSERAAKLVKELGFSNEKLKFFQVESFVLPGGWHLIFHFICRVSGDLGHPPNIRASKWVGLADLAEINDMAHGKWEISVARKYLELT
jgi:ADP-ribose pyrophosphatase YjhB (NUDIX family)